MSISVRLSTIGWLYLLGCLPLVVYFCLSVYHYIVVLVLHIFSFSSRYNILFIASSPVLTPFHSHSANLLCVYRHALNSFFTCFSLHFLLLLFIFFCWFLISLFLLVIFYLLFFFLFICCFSSSFICCFSLSVSLCFSFPFFCCFSSSFICCFSLSVSSCFSFSLFLFASQPLLWVASLPFI